MGLVYEQYHENCRYHFGNWCHCNWCMQTNLLVSNAVAAKVGTTKDRPITLDGEVYQNLSGKQFGKKYKGKFVKFDGLLTSVRP